MATEADKVNTGALATIVAVGAFAMVGISLALVALVRDGVSAEASLKDQTAGLSYRALVAEQQKKLHAGVPIEAAMQEIVREYSANPQQATPAGSAVPAPPLVGGAGGAGGASSSAAGGSVGAGAASSASLSGGAAGAATQPLPAGMDMAPGPTWQKDGKLAPGGGAPVPAPTPSAQAPGAVQGTAPKTSVPAATGAGPAPASTRTTQHEQ